jgi:soluble lytic murein transglycosylase-like protein
MSARTAAAVLLGLSGIFFILNKATASVSSSVNSPQDVKALAQRLIAQYGFNVSPCMATAIAILESGDITHPENGFNIYAARYEPGIDDTSTGLMQTLTGTAQWLARDMGYRAKGIPDAAALFDPETSMYFGISYLDFLKKYAGGARSDSWVVQSYNAGPGNSSGAYYTKYNKAILWLQKNGVC